MIVILLKLPSGALQIRLVWKSTFPILDSTTVTSMDIVSFEYWRTFSKHSQRRLEMTRGWPWHHLHYKILSASSFSVGHLGDPGRKCQIDHKCFPSDEATRLCIFQLLSAIDLKVPLGAITLWFPSGLLGFCSQQISSGKWSVFNACPKWRAGSTCSWAAINKSFPD